MGNETEFKPGNDAAKKHGMYSFRRRGEEALTVYQQGRYAELKRQFDSEPGRVEYRKELAVHVAMMLEIGFWNLREIVEKGGDIWTSPPIRVMGTYLNSLQRLLDGWPKERVIQDITDLLAGDEQGGKHGK